MTAKSRRAAKTNPAWMTGEQWARLEARKAEYRAMDAGDVLADLGRLVDIFEVRAYPIFAGWDVPEDAGLRPHGDRAYGYAVSYEIARPGRPTFRCGGFGLDIFTTLHEAAVYAVMGAHAWLGNARDETDKEAAA